MNTASQVSLQPFHGVVGRARSGLALLGFSTQTGLGYSREETRTVCQRLIVAVKVRVVLGRTVLAAADEQVAAWHLLHHKGKILRACTRGRLSHHVRSTDQLVTHLRRGIGGGSIGRWALGMLSGQFVHKNIIESNPLDYEESTGWVVHYLIGASLALTYPLFYLSFNVSMPANHVIPRTLWGLATVLLPWLTNFPAFGWGFFGVSGPEGTRPLIAPAIAHSCFGLAMGLVFTMTVANQRGVKISGRKGVILNGH